GATQLWAAASYVSHGSVVPNASVTVLREANEGTWTQVIPRGGSSPLGPSETLSGSRVDMFTSEETSAGDAIAPEPGTESAWLSLSSNTRRFAHVVLLKANGELVDSQLLPGSLDPVGARGEAGPITCAAEADCWMATSEGWLFHLGGSHERDSDPYFGGL